jgi:hypothetical protein
VSSRLTRGIQIEWVGYESVYDGLLGFGLFEDSKGKVRFNPYFVFAMPREDDPRGPLICLWSLRKIIIGVR